MMRTLLLGASCILFCAGMASGGCQSLDGQIGIHDPSTVVRCNNKFYTYDTGGNSLMFNDGYTWRRGTSLPRRGLAPDVIHLGDRYYVYVAANIGAQPKAVIKMISSRTLDPASPITLNVVPRAAFRQKRTM